MSTQRERRSQRMKYEKELRALLRNTDDEIIEALPKIVEAMLESQKAQEAEKYKAAFPLPPAEDRVRPRRSQVLRAEFYEM